MIFGGKSGNGTGFFPRASSAPVTIIPSMLYTTLLINYRYNVNLQLRASLYNALQRSIVSTTQFIISVKVHDRIKVKAVWAIMGQSVQTVNKKSVTV
jgi:hypothetical protein